MLKEVVSRRPAEIAFFYSHKDRERLELLMTHFNAGLRKSELAIGWYDDEINPGTDWQLDVEAHLSSADIIALLVSADFLSSHWCDIETRRALERSRRDGTIVVPIIVRACSWERSPIGRLKALPEDGKPLAEWPQLDKGCKAVVDGLHALIAQVSGRVRPKPVDVIVEERSNNLPKPLTSFIGRRAELSRLRDLLCDPDMRLIILVGLSGIGKTRLALKVATDLIEEFRDDVRFISLDHLEDAGQVMPTIAQALGVREEEAGPEAKNQADESSTKKRLKDYLLKRHMLLVLDSFEHVLSAGSDVSDLLRDCGEIKIILTSTRDPNINGAYSFEVPLLPVPESRALRLEDLQQVDSVALFLEIARKKCGFVPMDSDMPNVVEICSQVEGVPLAIELAAARTRLPLSEIVKELDNQLKLLVDDTQGVAERHKGMHAAIRWSYDTLRDNEKELFARISVFSGSFTWQAAQEVCNPAGVQAVKVARGIEGLLRSNFLQKKNHDGEPRFRLLRVFQEYGRELLQDARPFKRQHALFFASLAERAEPKLTSPDRGNWMERLDADYPNFRSALSWCKAENEPDLGLHLASALAWFWNLQANFSEGRNHLEAMLNAPSHDREARAKALYGLGMLVFLEGHFELAIEKLEESIAVWKSLTGKDYRHQLGAALIVLGMAASSLNRFPRARECEETSLAIFEDLQDKWWRALAHNDLGNVYRAQGDYEKAIGQYQKSRELWEEMKDAWGLPLTLSNLGFLEMQKGNYEKSRVTFERAQEIQQGAKDRWGHAETVKFLADLAVREDDEAEAARLYRTSLVLNQMIGRQSFVVGCLAGIAVLAYRRQQLGDAARLIAFVDRQRKHIRIYAKSIDHSMYQKPAEASHDCPRERSEGREMSWENAVELALRISAEWLAEAATD